MTSPSLSPRASKPPAILSTRLCSSWPGSVRCPLMRVANVMEILHPVKGHCLVESAAPATAITNGQATKISLKKLCIADHERLSANCE
jgi:hypothetical protein